MNCSTCGAGIVAGTSYCAKCGSAIPQANATSEPSATTSTTSTSASQQPLEGLEALKRATVICVAEKYASFDGRASRGEYWWFYLAQVLASIALSIVDIAIFGSDVLSNLLSLALLIPSIAASCRRLHDSNRSGWWLLLMLLPIIGWIILLIWLIQQSDVGDNQYGAPNPLSAKL
jgi:uncharacterized membrane protein YhaH (DUF805 family)